MSYPALRHALAAVTAPAHRARKQPLLPSIAKPKQSDRILFLSPHPDDETLFAGGFLATAVTSKARVRVALATDGNKQGHKEERDLEFRTATTALGLREKDLVFFDLPDGALNTVLTNLRAKIAQEIRSFQPTIVIAPHVADKHSDHQWLGQVASELQEKEAFVLYQYLAHYPPRYPWPRRHVRAAALMPPLGLRRQNWHAYHIYEESRRTRTTALQAYKRELSTITLRSLMLAFDRTNELFVVQHPPR